MDFPLLKMCLQSRKELDFVKIYVAFNPIMWLFVTISFSSTSDSKISVRSYLPQANSRYLLLKCNETKESICIKH